MVFIKLWSGKEVHHQQIALFSEYEALLHVLATVCSHHQKVSAQRHIQLHYTACQGYMAKCQYAIKTTMHSFILKLC
jgi:hypothetical protein